MSKVLASQRKTSLSPIIRWALGASLLACVWALWTPNPAPVVAASVPVDGAAQWTGRVVAVAARGDAGNAVGQTQPLPVKLPELVVRPPQRDIFETQPATAVSAAEPPHLPEPVPQPVPVAVAPEPLVVPFQFLGRMSAPNGAVLTFLAMHDEVIPIKPGDALPEGFKVVGISQNQITLHHEPTGQQVVIDLSAVQ